MSEISLVDGRLIAIDGDGVLVNYVEAYREVWFKAFGQRLPESVPNAYWSPVRWGAKHLEGPELVHFRSCLDAQFWRSLTPMPGAIAACALLRKAGFKLVCVSAIDEEFVADRHLNFLNHDMGIQTVYATGNDWDGQLEVSPKAKVLRNLMPAAFVDDFAPYLRGMPEGVHRALIESGMPGTPNVGHDLTLAESIHPSLLDFAKTWIARIPKPEGLMK